MAILFDFVMRLAFGLAVAMALTSPKQVTSGYYRIHMYVLLGLFVLATLVAASDRESFWLAPTVAGAVVSYAGSVIWLYECPRGGRIALGLAAVLALVAAWRAAPSPADSPLIAVVLKWLAPPTGGLVLGTTIAAMFLGHWYLNSPTMQLAPLRRLIVLMVGAVALRSIVCGAGLGLELATVGASTTSLWFFLLRWLAGIVAPLLLAWMAWKTLNIPNTQSATGILYVAVIVVFTGELTSQLLSTACQYPV